MSLVVPLVVRIKSRRSDLDITAQIGDLSFRISIPGGYASCQISLMRPLDIQPDEIEYFGTVFVYDGRNGRTIWEGRLEDPARGSGDTGEVWSLTATGPMAHAQDRAFPVIYVDQSLERWHRSLYTSSKVITEQTELDEDTPSLMIRATEGDAISTSWTGDWIYRSIYYCGQRIAPVRADVISDASTTTWRTGIFTRVASGAAVYSVLNNWSTSSQVLGAYLGSSGWDPTVNVASFRSQKDVSAVTAGEQTASYFYNIIVRALLKNADGTDNLDPASYVSNTLDPSDVVKDLLGRVLTKFDGTTAVIIASGVDIEQMAYPDGTTAAAILEDLALFDPGFYWAAWESNLEGKNRFEYVPWPSALRYEATTEDGFDSPGSASELFNAVRVRWRDAKGRVRNTRRTQTVQELSDAGLTREGYIDISDDMGAAFTATYVGDNFLAEHRYPPNAGTLRIRRPILDNLTGRMVDPWEILPGHLIRVRGVLPRVDSLNPTARDGVTIFRVISVEFSATDGAAVLELDSFTRTVSRQLAETRKTVTRTPTTTWHSAARVRKR